MAKICRSRTKVELEENLRRQDGRGFKSGFLQIHHVKLTLEFFSLKQSIESAVLEQCSRTDRVGL